MTKNTAYGRVSPRFWTRSAGWEDRQRLLALYLKTCGHKSTEGLYHLPHGYIVTDLEWPARTVAAKMSALGSVGFIDYDASTNVVLVRDALEDQIPGTDMQIRGAVKRLEQLPPTPLLAHFVALARDLCPKLVDEMAARMPSAIEVAQAMALEWHSSVTGNGNRVGFEYSSSSSYSGSSSPKDQRGC